jgi:hypothetical protein
MVTFGKLVSYEHTRIDYRYKIELSRKNEIF